MSEVVDAGEFGLVGYDYAIGLSCPGPGCSWNHALDATEHSPAALSNLLGLVREHIATEHGVIAATGEYPGKLIVPSEGI